MTTSAPLPDTFALDSYMIRRKVLKVLGGAFHVYAGDRIIGFSKQKAFKLKEDIRVFTNEAMTEELLLIKARQIIDFSAAYDIVDSASGSKVGAARRKGMASLVRDSWEVMDANDQTLAQLVEDSAGMALARRFINLIPQTFRLDAKSGGAPVIFKQHFNPFVYKLDVKIPQRCALDRRLIFGVAVLLCAIEGRQQN